MALTLFQKVIISCQEIYSDWMDFLTGEAVYAKFLDLWFYTPDKNTTKAMTRRFADMVSCWLLVTCNSWWKLTPLWRRVNPKHCHIVSSLQIKDCTKISDMPRRGSKKKEIVRKPIEENIIKQQCKEYLPPIKPTTIIWKQFKWLDVYVDDKLKWSIDFDKNITDVLNPMTPKPKHTLRQHLKSLFWL